MQGPNKIRLLVYTIVLLAGMAACREKIEGDAEIEKAIVGVWAYSEPYFYFMIEFNENGLYQQQWYGSSAEGECAIGDTTSFCVDLYRSPGIVVEDSVLYAIENGDVKFTNHYVYDTWRIKWITQDKLKFEDKTFKRLDQ